MASTAGDRRGLAVLAGLIVAVVVQPVACDGGGKGGPDGEVTEAVRRVLAEVGSGVVIPTIDRSIERAQALGAALDAWSADAGDEAARAAAQDAWVALMDAWQEAEVHQLGPAGSTLTVVGGLGLRDEVYSWPTVNPCRVDQETVTSDWAAPAFFEDELVNAYGLDALETLLFSPPGVNACPSQVDINAYGTWDALGTDGVQEQRARYASAVAAHVAATLGDLRGRWDPAGGDFSGTLAAAGEAGSPYDSAEQGLNAVFDALYYLELETQDTKLADPLGLGDCTTDCLGLVETPVAGGSHRWVAANLRGFRALFTGGDGQGMDDLLGELGHADVADAVLAALDDADAAAAALTVPIDVAATTDPAPAVALLEAVRGVTDLLEGDVATILALQIPSEAAGDND